MSGKATPLRVVTEFVLRIPDGWAGRIAEAVTALTAAGAEVTRVVPDRGVLAGVIESWFVGDLSQLPCAEGIVEGASYVVDADGRHVRRPRQPGRATAMGPWDNAAPDHHRGGKGPSGAHGHGPRRASTRPVDLLDLVQDDEVPTHGRPDDIERIGDGQNVYGHDPFEPVDWPAPGGGIPEERVLEIPWTARIGYSVVAILAMCLIVHAAVQGQDHRGCAVLAQVCASALLFSLSVTAALGLCRYRLVRHACTVLGLLVTLLPCLLWDDVPLARVVPGLLAFLIAGITDESLSPLR